MVQHLCWTIRLSLSCPFSKLQTEPAPSQCPANRQGSVRPRRVPRDLGSVSAGTERSGTGKHLQEENLQEAERRSGNERKQKTQKCWGRESSEIPIGSPAVQPLPLNKPPPSCAPSQASALKAGAPRCAAPPVQAQLQQSHGGALQHWAQFPLQSTGLGAAAWHSGLWQGAQLAQGDAVPSARLWAMLAVQPGKELHVPQSNAIIRTLGSLPEISVQAGSFNPGCKPALVHL